MALSSQDILFAHNLMKGMTIVDAAIEAGFSENTARKQAALWIGNNRSQSKKPLLYDYYESLKKKAESEAVATLQENLEFLTEVLRSDVKDFMEFDGYATYFKKFDDVGDKTKLIHKLKLSKGKGHEFELYSKMDAVEKFMKHFGAYKDKIEHEHSGPGGGPIKTENKTSFIDLSNLEDDKQKQALKFIFGNNTD